MSVLQFQNDSVKIRIEPEHHTKVQVILQETRESYARMNNIKKADRYIVKLRRTEDRLRQGYTIKLTSAQFSILQAALEEVGMQTLVKVLE